MKQATFHNRIIKRFLTLLTGMVILNTACESVLFIELEESDRLIVLNGTLAVDSLVRVQVSRTRHILDNAPLTPLKNATVLFSRNGDQPVSLTHRGNGWFEGDQLSVHSGDIIELEVECPSYPGVHGSLQIPSAVPIYRIDTSMQVIEVGGPYYSYTEGYVEFDLTLEDPPGEKNYYLVDLMAHRSVTEWRDTTVQYVDSIYHNGQWNYFVSDSSYTYPLVHPITDRPSIGSEDLAIEAVTQQGLLISDQLIDGQRYSIRFSTMSYNLQSADSALVHIRLHSIDESYYKYLKSRQNHYYATDDYLAVPVIVYSNVVGGTGILGGYATDVCTITTFIPEESWDYYYYDF